MEVNCNLCNHYIRLEEYDRHFKKCSAIKYIQKKTKKLYNKEIEYSELYRLDGIEFNKRYFMLLNRVYEQTTDERETIGRDLWQFYQISRFAFDGWRTRAGQYCERSIGFASY